MKVSKLSIAVSSAVALSVLAATARADDKLDASKLPPASSQQDVTYAKDIKAIFDKSCIKCHGGEKPKGKLRLETLEGAIKGSKDGKVIVPGKSGESPLVFAVAHVGDEDDFMPPPKNKANIGPLTKEQVGLIRAWVDQGAK
jgi:mono/diheme cytochrome c family protein